MHIVCFDQPYPPSYGGAIDVFYRIKKLHEAGIPLVLHIFIYRDRKPQREVEQLAENVFYYKRNLGLRPNLSFKPYIAVSRNCPQLLDNLCLDNEPILFEGLHTTFFLDSNRLEGRRKIVRMHNIEHKYYLAMAKSNILSPKSPFYFIESVKLRFFEKILLHASLILPISTEDCKELKERFPHKDIRLMNCFFDNTFTPKTSSKQKESERYILYHGNLALEENIRAAKYIISHSEEIIPKRCKLVIAGRNPAPSLLSSLNGKENIIIIANPSSEEMEKLLVNAHVNLLLTFQQTGVKLKLLNTLTKSHGFCVVNRQMLYGTYLHSLCHEANTLHDISQKVHVLMKKETDEEEYLNRQRMIKSLGFNSIQSLLLFLNCHDERTTSIT